MRTGSEMQDIFSIFYYLYPLLIFGMFNTLLVCSFLFLLSLTVKKKLFVVVGGLFLYIFYMVVLLFSNSPFMAGSLPQSQEAQQISSLLDPFGLSAYFLESKNLTVQQKNQQIVPLTGYLLYNRILFLLISGGFLLLTDRLFSFSNVSGKKQENQPLKHFQFRIIPDQNILWSSLISGRLLFTGLYYLLQKPI